MKIVQFAYIFCYFGRNAIFVINFFIDLQLTEEKLGTSERTEFDSHFESLSERAENTKAWTDKIVRNTEAVLIPNPGNRAEDYLFEKIEKKRPTRLSNLEYLGLDMIEAGGVFGASGAYGSALVKVGQTEQKLGQAERDLIVTAEKNFVQPMRQFLEGEMKTITREKGILESKRLVGLCVLFESTNKIRHFTFADWIWMLARIVFERREACWVIKR